MNCHYFLCRQYFVNVDDTVSQTVILYMPLFISFLWSPMSVSSRGTYLAFILDFFGLGGRSVFAKQICMIQTRPCGFAKQLLSSKCKE